MTFKAVMPRLTVLFGLSLFCLAVSADSIVLVSDLNGRYGSKELNSRVPLAVSRILEQPPDLVLSTGDMVAGQQQPRLNESWLNEMWTEFHRVVSAPLANAGVPLLITPGNHDGSAFPSFRLEREQFVKQWSTAPGNVELYGGSDWPQRYAARNNGILVVAFDGTRPGRLEETEKQFLREALGAWSADARLTIVISHLPMWPLARGREKEIINDSELLALLHRYGVDVYASGHHHVFFAGTDQAGMLHLGVGALGGNVRPFSGQSARQSHSYVQLDVNSDELLVKARVAPDFTGELPLAELPQRIEGPLGDLQRISGPVRLSAKQGNRISQ